MPGASFLKYIATLILVAGMLALPRVVHADMVMVGQPVDTCVARAVPGQSAADLFAGRIPIDCSTPQTDFGPGDYWVLSSRVSRTGEVALRSSSVWQQRRTVYARYADGQILSRTTDSAQASRSLQLGAIFLDRLPARHAPLVQVAWKIDKSPNLRGIVLSPRLATPHDNALGNLASSAIYAGFAGLALALIVHHLALWTALRHRFQLAYCAMLAGLLCYAFTSSGALAWLMPAIDNNDRQRLNYVALGLASASALIFARTFFEKRVFDGALGTASKAVTIAIIATSCGFTLLAPFQMVLLDRLFAYAYLALLLFVPALLVRAWMVRSNYLWLFAIAWTAPVAFAGLRVANGLHLIGWSFWVDNSTLLSMASEALLSSIGISYRIRLLSRERDEARVKELAAQALADTDPLTGLLNRRAFLHRAIGREDRQALLILDIDHFKSVNETIGHDGGDEVLRLVTRVLRRAAPPGALVARIGGEEFAVVVDEAQPLDGEELLAELRAERMPFDLAVTACVGRCTGPLTSEADWKRLYRSADRALYDAKAQGRDRARTGQPILAAA